MAESAGPGRKPSLRARLTEAWWVLIPGAVAGVIGLLVPVLAPETARAVLSSGASLLRVAVIGVVALLLVALLWRFVPSPGIRFVVLAVLTLALGWWTLSPLLTERRVDQALPGAEVAAATPDTSMTLEGASETDMMAEPSETAMSPAGEATEEPVAPAEPVKLTSGQFSGLAGHSGSGEAAIYRLPGGTAIVRFEDFEVTNGPDLEVWLVPGEAQEAPGEGTRLAPLEASQGSLNIPIPADADLGAPSTVLIWCRAFAVPFAQATQAAV